MVTFVERFQDSFSLYFHWPFPITNNVPQSNEKKNNVINILWEWQKKKQWVTPQLSKNCVELALFLLRYFLTKYKSTFKVFILFLTGYKVFVFFSLPLQFVSVLMTENLLGLMIWLVLKIEQSCQELCVICGGHRLLWS